MRLEIELQDGSFEVVSGPPGTDVQVDGAYAKNYYELIEEHSAADASGGPTTSIRLRPTSSSLVRMMAIVRAGRDSTRQPNKLTVAIPAGLPIALTLRVSQGESRIDLGGVWRDDDVTTLSFNHSMGDLRLRIPTAVRIAANSQNSVRWGESGRIGRGEETSDPDTPVLRLNLSTSMGETRIVRYEVAMSEELTEHLPSLTAAEPPR